MEIRHQTVVQHTPKFSSDGPYVINTAPRRVNRRGKEESSKLSANSTYKSAVLSLVRSKVTTST